MGSQTFNIEALLLVLHTTEYQERVPVAIGTIITDMAVDFIDQNKPDHVSKSWKVVAVPPIQRDWYRHSPVAKGSIKTTKPSHCHPSPQQ